MRYKGVFTALITPMKDGELDHGSLKSLLESQIEHGVDGLVVNGTTGETPALTQREQIQMVEWVMEEVGGRVPVVAGVGSNNTQTTIENARRMEQLAVDGLLVVTPYYNKPNQAGLDVHFRAVADAVETSIILYNVPGRTGVSLAPDTIASLAVLPNVEAIKEATVDMERASQVIAAAGDHAAVLAGDDTAFLPMLALGAKGIVSAVSNVIPEPFAKLYKMYSWGDLDEARELHYAYFGVIRAMLSEVNPLGVKVAAQTVGLIDSDEVRTPLAQMSEADKALLREMLSAGGVVA